MRQDIQTFAEAMEARLPQVEYQRGKGVGALLGRLRTQYEHVDWAVPFHHHHLPGPDVPTAEDVLNDAADLANIVLVLLLESGILDQPPTIEITDSVHPLDDRLRVIESVNLEDERSSEIRWMNDHLGTDKYAYLAGHWIALGGYRMIASSRDLGSLLAATQKQHPLISKVPEKGAVCIYSMYTVAG